MLFPSTLIISNSTPDTVRKLNELTQSIGQRITSNNPDIFTVNQTTRWGIDVVRQIHTFLATKPYSHQNKIVLVYDAHKLLTEAQNSLLKILEEPGDTNFIILTTTKPYFILPTIISRCIKSIFWTLPVSSLPI
jgi:DNA polymerase III subunit delta'